MSAFAASSTAPRDASRRRVAYSFASCRRASDASERTRDESDARRSELASAEVWRSAASRSDDATRSMESSMRRSDASNSEAFEAVETDEGGVASGSNPGAVVRASADADADAEGKGEGEEPAGEAAAAEEAAPIATEPPPPPPRSFSLPGAEFWDAGGGVERYLPMR